MVREVPLYEMPLERARIVSASVLPAYKDSIAHFGEKARATLYSEDKLSVVGDELAGENPFISVHLLNSGLVKKLATRRNIETARALDKTKTFLADNYAGVGLSLTQGEEHVPNILPAETLMKQLEYREIQIGDGKLIPYNVLRIVENQSSNYGLVFVLNDEIGNKEMQEQIRNLSEFPWNYIRKGLSRAYFDGGAGWSADVRHLGDSNRDGRVVEVVAEGNTPQISKH